MRIFYNFASNCSTSQSYHIVVIKFKNNDGNQWEKAINRSKMRQSEGSKKKPHVFVVVV